LGPGRRHQLLGQRVEGVGDEAHHRDCRDSCGPDGHSFALTDIHTHCMSFFQQRVEQIVTMASSELSLFMKPGIDFLNASRFSSGISRPIVRAVYPSKRSRKSESRETLVPSTSAEPKAPTPPLDPPCALVWAKQSHPLPGYRNVTRFPPLSQFHRTLHLKMTTKDKVRRRTTLNHRGH